MTTRRLTFEQVADSRFDNGLSELEQWTKDIIEKLSALPDVSAETSKPRKVTFSQEKSVQWRRRFWISKSSRKTTWEQVKIAVNSVKAPYYQMV